MYRGFRGLTFFSRVGKSLYQLSTIEMYHKQQFLSHLSNFDSRKACLSLKNTVSTDQICEVENWGAPSQSEWVANIIKNTAVPWPSIFYSWYTHRLLMP